MNKKCIIISQTGSDLSLSEAAKLNVKLIPDYIRFGDDAFRCKTEISDRDFYRRMAEEKELPTSSHPALGDFLDAYRKARDEGADEALCITVTADMSGSYQTAVTAGMVAGQDKCRIYVYDSRQCSHGVVPVIREAARLAKTGLGAEEIIRQLDAFVPRISVYFMLDTLENARKGGRVGKITATCTEILGIKPIMTFRDGECSNYVTAVGSRSGEQKLLEILKNDVDCGYGITVFHGDAEEEAGQLAERISEEYPQADVSVEYVGSVIGIFSGPGAIGIAYVRRGFK